MKKKILLILIVSLLAIITVHLSFFSKNSKDRLYSNNSTQPTEYEEVLSSEIQKQSDNLLGFQFNDKNFMVSWFKVEDLSKTNLITNFKNKLTSKEILDKYNCRYLINGGFYSKDYLPIGLFINKEGQLSTQIQNNLFNGILSLNYFEIPRITRILPQDELFFAIQTGPLLIENDSAQNLRIKNDTYDRRVISAITGNNELYFLVIYDKNSSFSGPKLTDLPNILSEVEKSLSLDLADAINLDGGTASVFISPEIKLSELTSVGSFF